MIAPKNAHGGDFKQPPTGSFVARCIRIEDLGTQKTVWKGTEKQVRKVRIVWELPTEKAVFREERGEEPFVVSSTYTFSMYSGSALRRDLESWRGVKFGDPEAEAFDLSKVLDKTCMVNLSMSKDQKYVNVSGVMQLPKNMEVPPRHCEGWIFDLNEPNWDIFKKMSRGVREKIAASPEFSALEIPQDVADLLTK